MNRRGLCGRPRCASILPSLDSTLWHCNRRHRKQRVCHRIAHSARPPSDRPMCASIGHAQYPKREVWHRVIHSRLCSNNERKKQVLIGLCDGLLKTFNELTFYHANACIAQSTCGRWVCECSCRCPHSILSMCDRCCPKWWYCLPFVMTIRRRCGRQACAGICP